jgi:hypothetical protein
VPNLGFFFSFTLNDIAHHNAACLPCTTAPWAVPDLIDVLSAGCLMRQAALDLRAGMVGRAATWLAQAPAAAAHLDIVLDSARDSMCALELGAAAEPVLRATSSATATLLRLLRMLGAEDKDADLQAAVETFTTLPRDLREGALTAVCNRVARSSAEVEPARVEWLISSLLEARGRGGGVAVDPNLTLLLTRKLVIENLRK